MKFTIELRRLIGMIGSLRGRERGKRTDSQLVLSACQARVFVASGGNVAGEEALVLEDGSCVLPRVRFEKVLKTFRPKPNITVEADAQGLRIERFEMEVRSYSPTSAPPDHFDVPPVWDTWLATPSPAVSARPESPRDAGGRRVV
jgi:hypothetical protein